MSSCPTDVTFNDIDEIFVLPDSPRQGECIQLDPGPLGLVASLAALPNLHIYSWAYTKRILGREIRTDGSLCLALRLDQGPPAWINGQLIPHDTPLIRYGGFETEFCTAPGMRMIEVDVPAELLDIFGWRPRRPIDTLPLSPADTTRLRRILTETAACMRARPDLTEEQLRALQDGLLLTLGGCLTRGLDQQVAPLAAGRAARLFSLANEYMASLSPGERLSITSMAVVLGVSARSIYKAYQEFVGMGPYEFDLLRRVHAFRTELIRAPRGRGAVARAAQLASFKDQSRLGQLYRRHFGEVPTATARRWRDREPGLLPPPRSLRSDPHP